MHDHPPGAVKRNSMLHRTLGLLLAIGLALGVASAQDAEQRFDAAFVAGIKALGQGRSEDSIRNFKTCLALRPRHSSSAYNLGCVYSVRGEKEQAFEWLGKASEWGFGDMGVNIAHAQRDQDLAKLRSDPRFEAFIDGMKKRKRKLEEAREALRGYWSKPEIYIPSALAKSDRYPLLVVLHDSGERKEQVILGRWRRVADLLGSALIVPSGKYKVSEQPDAGMSWFDTIEGYSDNHWTYERTVHHAVNAFKQQHELEVQRVFLAGEGQGATVAFNIAVTAPGLYKGVLLLNGLPLLQLAAPQGQLAGRMGLRAHLIIERGDALGQPSGASLEALQERVTRALEFWKIPSQTETPQASGGARLATDEHLAEVLRGFTQDLEKLQPATGE